MEEKERYTIESFEIEEPSFIFYNKTSQIILTLVNYNYDEITHLKDLLNHYFKRIKELEQENLKLKQQLHDLPKKIVGEVEKNFTEYLPLKYKTGAGFYSRLNAIFKKYGGEDE